MAQVEQYLAGAQARSLAPGDFILTHRHNWMAGLITQAQKRRFHGPDAVYAHWSHAAVVAPGGTVIEAEIRGVVRNPIARYRDDEYRLVRLASWNRRLASGWWSTRPPGSARLSAFSTCSERPSTW
jgi:uncharacterized protein YycO